MSLAVWVKSESGDAYLYSFDDNVTFEEVQEKLTDNYDYFCPLSEFHTAIGGDTKPSLETCVTELLIEMCM